MSLLSGLLWSDIGRYGVVFFVVISDSLCGPIISVYCTSKVNGRCSTTSSWCVLLCEGSGLEMTDILDYSQTMSRPLRVIYPGAVYHSRPGYVQESSKRDVQHSAPYPAFCLEAAQVHPFLKQTLTSAIEIPLKPKGMPRKRRKINDTRENKPKRDLTPSY